MGEKTYQGKTMRDAWPRCGRDIGGDAVILASREVRRHWLFGLGRRELIEVKASASMPEAATLAQADPPLVWPINQADRNGLSVVDLPSELFAGYAQLLEAEVPDLLVRRLVRTAADGLEPTSPETCRRSSKPSARPSNCASPSRLRAGRPRDAPGCRPGWPHGRRQDDNRGQARSQFQAGARPQAGACHRRHLSDRRG